MSSGNTLGSEVVEFRADGLDEIIARTADLEAAVRKAHAEQLKQLQAMASPALAKAALDLTKIKARTDDLAKAERQQREQAVRNSRLLSGEYAMQARLRDQAAKAARTAAQAERATELGQGIYAARAKATARADRRDARLALAEQRADLAAGVSLYRAKTAAAAAVQQARLGQGLRAQSLSSGLYGQQSRDAARLERTDARLGVAEKASDLRSGVTLTRMKTAAAVERADAQLALATRRLALSSGVFSQQVAARAKAEGENAALAKAERRAELQALYGRRLGGAIHAGERFAPGLATASGALAGAGAIGVGMGRAGFSGTVQGHTWAREVQLLNREVANSLVPAMRELTGVIRWMRRQLEKLTPAQQKGLGYAITGATIAGGLGLGAIGSVKAVSMGAAALRSMGLIGGEVGGATAKGSSVLSRLGSWLGIGGRTATAESGSLASMMAKGNWSGVSGAGVAPAGQAAGGVGWLAKAGRLGGRALGPVGVALGAGADVVQSGAEVWNDGRRGAGRALGQIADTALLSFRPGGAAMQTQGINRGGPIASMYDAVFGARNNLPATPGIKTQALIADAGFETFDSAYQRVASEVALTDAGERERGGKLASGDVNQQQLDELREIRKELERQRQTPPLR